jgi:hypothetical protein
VIALRQNNVPRYLFRAWHGASGGAPETYLNTRHAVVRQIFMLRASSEAEKYLPCFYEIPEDALYRMASDYYSTCFNVATGFSSWATSLHLVPCYAKYLNGKYMTDTVHVAVIDTHVLHLLGNGNHEYLAFGRIRGNGYRAVSLADSTHMV